VKSGTAFDQWRQNFGDVMRSLEIDSQYVIDEIAWRKNDGLPRAYEQAAAGLTVGLGNCLIIPLLGEWSSIRLLNTTSAPKILDDIQIALRPPQTRPVFALSPAGGFGGAQPEGGMIFLKFSIYDIVLAERATDIPDALSQIDATKRPEVNKSVFDAMSKYYDCPVAVCCFNSGQSATAKPIAFAFEPRYEDRLTIYTLDGHDGAAPDLSKTVALDHTIFVGSYLTNVDHGVKVQYSDSVADDLRPYLLPSVLGTDINEPMLNGDFCFAVEDVRKGHLLGKRSLPPHAPQNLQRKELTLTRNAPYLHHGDSRRFHS
jgi:hypothetical protein